jgi:hypothetical protein
MDMARQVGFVFLATADSAVGPHISIVQPAGLDDQERVKLLAWLSPFTWENLQRNPKVSVVIWDAHDDNGFQLSASVEEMKPVAQLYARALSAHERERFPRVEWKLLLRMPLWIFIKHPTSIWRFKRRLS